MPVKASIEIERMIKRLGTDLDTQTSGKLQLYIQLLKKWNKRINLTASNDPSIIEPLLQEGVWASRFYPKDAKTHLDIGSGAGFPAIPLNILVPHICLKMIDSRFKKIAFLETVVRELGLKNTSAYHGRIEDYLKKYPGKWDCISWKGIKISTKVINELKKRAHPKSQFWIFHGKKPALEEPEQIVDTLKLLRSEKYPHKSEWMLSIYTCR